MDGEPLSQSLAVLDALLPGLEDNLTAIGTPGLEDIPCLAERQISIQKDATDATIFNAFEELHNWLGDLIQHGEVFFSRFQQMNKDICSAVESMTQLTAAVRALNAEAQRAEEHERFFAAFDSTFSLERPAVPAALDDTFLTWAQRVFRAQRALGNIAAFSGPRPLLSDLEPAVWQLSKDAAAALLPLTIPALERGAFEPPVQRAAALLLESAECAEVLGCVASVRARSLHKAIDGAGSRPRDQMAALLEGGVAEARFFADFVRGRVDRGSFGRAVAAAVEPAVRAVRAHFRRAVKKAKGARAVRDISDLLCLSSQYVRLAQRTAAPGKTAEGEPAPQGATADATALILWARDFFPSAQGAHAAAVPPELPAFFNECASECLAALDEALARRRAMRLPFHSECVTARKILSAPETADSGIVLPLASHLVVLAAAERAAKGVSGAISALLEASEALSAVQVEKNRETALRFVGKHLAEWEVRFGSMAAERTLARFGLVAKSKEAVTSPEEVLDACAKVEALILKVEKTDLIQIDNTDVQDAVLRQFKKQVRRGLERARMDAQKTDEPSPAARE
eukprot:gnl/Chilomastix_cuspidata/2874.p1 GENE.gnl/Chilomastix_cuspidata/2874~~gnl/Chilomastix_cuspidata/2874.p1  ORF type:complete len:572 (+),score=172.63 gnl/Chilomastix_cuspidata/2874:180-1895(+)